MLIEYMIVRFNDTISQRLVRVYERRNMEKRRNISMYANVDSRDTLPTSCSESAIKDQLNLYVNHPGYCWYTD